MRNNRFTKRASFALLALLLFALPLISACSPAGPAAQGKGAAAKGPLKLGFSMPMTGPAAEKGVPMGQGKLDAVKYINEELGGVEGHPIQVSWYDTKYDAAQSATIVKKLMDEGNLFFTTSASKDMAASQEIANRAGFPGMVSFGAPQNTRPPQHIYIQAPDYGDDWGAFTNYYMKNLWKKQGKPKMALLLLNNPTGYGVRDAAKAMADKLGVEIVAVEEHAATTISEIEALTRVKGKNPDVLFISSTPAPTSIILKNANELGMLQNITVGMAKASFTKVLIDMAGKAAEGVYGVYPTVTWGENVPGMAKVMEYAKKYHPEHEGNLDYLISWAEALIDAEIMRQAVKSAGYEVLAKGNEESWKAIEEKGFRNVKGYDVQGLQGPVDFSNPQDRRGSKSVRVYQVKDGKFQAVSGWVEAPLIKYEEFPWFG
ncbi:MAG: ABC transporter substrate-binding protein [Chloroflexi bacterium]|nr:ABC transporter substrate-binding protein [Chloroflexota bacterium]